MSDHNAFAHPTVAEALCEIHFDLAADADWLPAWFSQFHAALRPDFPDMEPQSNYEMTATIGPDGLVQRVVPSGIRARYVHAERPHLVQLAPGTLTVNELTPYPGWPVFIADIQSAWEKITTVVHPDRVYRIGLRYINRVPRSNGDTAVGEWLAESQYFPAALRSARGHFLSRFERGTDDGARIIVTVADIGRPAPDAGTSSPDIVLDIDAILEASFSTAWPTIATALDGLHDQVWAIFESSIGPRFRASLSGD